jgi:hypothetical protein
MADILTDIFTDICWGRVGKRGERRHILMPGSDNVSLCMKTVRPYTDTTHLKWWPACQLCVDRLEGLVAKGQAALKELRAIA